MGFELPNGKTARNIQEQVKFLTEKLKDLYSRVNDLEIHIQVVEELPETGVEGTIYLLPASEPEEGNYYEEYIWLDDAWELIGTTQVDLSQYYTKTEADAKFVDLTSAQTISGAKTFTSPITYKNSFDVNWIFEESGNYNVNFKRGTSVLFGFGTSQVYFPNSPIPNGNGLIDIGNSSHYWKDGYFSGQVYAENTLNVINASDIVNNTLTEAQYDLITNGKPTLIKGTFLGYNNIFVLPVYYTFGSNLKFQIRCNIGTRFHEILLSINTSTRVCSVDGTTKHIVVYNIASINNKNIPDYPSSPASPQYLTYGTNNQLSWTGGASGTILYKHAIVLSNGNTFYIINNSSTPLASGEYEFITAAYLRNALVMKYQRSIVLDAPAEGGSTAVHYLSNGSIVSIELSNYNIVSDTVTQF